MSTRARGRASAKSDGTGSAGAPGGMGRSGARSRAPDAPSRPPHESTMRDLIEDQPAMEGQFDDADEDKKPAEVASSTHSAPSLIEGNESNFEQTAPPSTPRDNESSNSSINPTTPEFSPPSTKLNPSAPVFSPTQSSAPFSTPNSSATSKLNPRTPEFSPSMVNGTNSQTHYSAPANAGARSTLDPCSSAFIPKMIPKMIGSVLSLSSLLSSSLNVSAPAFVPHEPLPNRIQNGRLDDEEEDVPRGATPPVEGGDDNDGEPLLLTPKDILSGVKFPVEQQGDIANDSILKAAAEVLIKTTLYPGSFDRGATKLENSVKSWLPTDATLSNLAEMLIHWAVTEPNLRLSVSRICQVLCDIEQIKSDFRIKLVCRLKLRFDERASLEKDTLINLSLLFAELFSRIRMVIKETQEEQPVRVLGDAVLELLPLLLERVDERSVISACHVLKLTGPLFATFPPENGEKLNKIIAKLVQLSTAETLPLTKKCVEIMVRVLELQARGWGQPVRPLTSTPITQSVVVVVGGASQVMDGVGGGAGHMAPVDSVSIGEGAVLSEAEVLQAPVSNPDEWIEFLDDDNQLIEDSDQQTTECFVIERREEGGEGEDELDAEMEKEFEFFVQDLEEHLLNVGEMDPEQFQEQ